MDRILIIRLSAMGDVLLTTPILRWIRNSYPDAIIDFLVKKRFSSLLLNNPNIDHVLELDTEYGLIALVQLIKKIRSSKYTKILDLQTNPRSLFVDWMSKAKEIKRYSPDRLRRYRLVHQQRHLKESFPPIPLRMLEAAKNWGVHDDGQGLDLEIDGDAKNWITKRLSQNGWSEKEPYLVIAPGAGRKTKRWLENRFADVGSHFMKKDFKIVLVGGTLDQIVCSNISAQIGDGVFDFSGKTTLQQTAAIIDGSRLLITNDTGVMHMGTAVKKPVLAIFGPTTHHLGFFPFRALSTVIEQEIDCRPCSYHGTEECPQEHFNCMRDISVTSVIKAAETLLKESK